MERLHTPEQRAQHTHRALYAASHTLCARARDCGVSDARIKRLVLALREPDTAILTDDEVWTLIASFNLGGA